MFYEIDALSHTVHITPDETELLDFVIKYVKNDVRAALAFLHPVKPLFFNST